MFATKARIDNRKKIVKQQHLPHMPYNMVNLNHGYMCNYCMQRAEIHACNNCRLSNVLENIHEAKVLQPMTLTAFGRIT